MKDRLLIADDEADIVTMLTSFFEGKGYEVMTASDGGSDSAGYQHAGLKRVGGLQAHPGPHRLPYPFPYRKNRGYG